MVRGGLEVLRLPIDERPNWTVLAHDYGFNFHTLHGERYWDERAYYQFSLAQIERDIEGPSEEVHAMCLAAVAQVVNDAQLMERFRIPEIYWDFLRQSWLNSEPSLYSRLDFAYDGRSPAKLYENNADTPTSVYETGFWQWLWLEDNVKRGRILRSADQFNSLQEKLINRFNDLAKLNPGQTLYFACCKNSTEDRGTVQYLEDCAYAANIDAQFIYIEDIGCSAEGQFTDLEDHGIHWAFKLYPWEFMLRDEFGSELLRSHTHWLEPPWKSLLSNKALMPLLWKMFKGHPNLLPAYFEDELNDAGESNSWVKKPIFSREGANISISKNGEPLIASSGPYGEEGYIYQATHLLPRFGEYYTLVGSWLVDDEAAGISIREDSGPITQDMSRYLPHVILD